MRPIADLHTHTVASGHGYSTIQEMARAASEKGIEILGITEHGPRIPGSCDWLYFKNLIVVPREMYGVKLLLGAEIDILDTEGTLDMTDDQMRALDIRIAGIHPQCWTPGTAEHNTEAMIKVVSNPLIDIISHPADGAAELIMEPIVLAAREHGTHLEINNHSLNPARHKTVARGNNLELLRLCKKYEVPVTLGSDAHISFMIADYSNLYPLLAETDFPDALILNDKPERLLPKHRGR